MSTASPRHSNPPPASRGGRTPGSTVRWQRDVSEALYSLGALVDADYADVVTATIDATPPEPERFVHEVLDDLPHWLPLLIAFVQRVFLGLRLKLRPSPDRLLGWKIVERGGTWMRIESASWFMTSHVVIHVAAGRVSVASFIRYDRRLAAFVWPPVSLIHRRVALALVHRGTRAL
jgi:hypothetical protein